MISDFLIREPSYKFNNIVLSRCNIVAYLTQFVAIHFAQTPFRKLEYISLTL
jgi:hypothetical protein